MSPALEDRPESWPVTATTDLYRDTWVMALRSDELYAPGHPGRHETFTRWVLEHPGAVIILAVDEERRVFCLWQYRHPAQRRFVELPAGLLDKDGEDPETAGRRELREEAGLEAASWTHVGTTWSSPGISAEVMHFYLAQGLQPAGDDSFVPHHEEAEMTGEWVPFDELLAAVVDGRVADGPLVQGVLLAQAKGLVT